MTALLFLLLPNGILPPRRVNTQLMVANEASDYAWFASQGAYGAKEVAQKTANSAGIFDTYGNVYEWTDDVAYLVI